MAENTKTDELYDELDQRIIDALCVDPRVQWSYSQRKAVRQLINSAVHQTLDTVQASSDKGMYIGDQSADVLANHRKVIDEAIETERNKYPLNKEGS